jgi:hypothetical protein
MEAGKRWYRLGVIAALVALVVLAMALVPGAQARAGYTNCGNKKITIQIEDGEGGTRPYMVGAKAVQVKNLSCADGVDFIREVMEGSNPGKYGYPQNYKCKAGNFDVPTGYYPQICTRGNKGIKWGQQGG